MTRKEIPTPTSDKLAQDLAKIEMATVEEEQERKERGLTQEPTSKKIKKEKPIPIGDVVPPGTQIHLPSLPELRTKSVGREEQLELREKDIKYYLAEWENKNRDYELTHLSQGTIIKLEGEAYDLPVEFVDYLIVEAIKSDMVEDYRQLLFSILHNLDNIRIYNTSSTIQIGLRDNENNLIRLVFYIHSKPPFAFYKAE